jgi:CRISPR-associated protein Cas1
LFRETRLLNRIIPAIEEMLDAGELPRPQPEGVVGPAIIDPAGTGDAGHRG